MWWLYFKWQWLRDAHYEHAGAAGHARRALPRARAARRLGPLAARPTKSFWFFGPLMFTMTLLLIYYLNFKYGAFAGARARRRRRSARCATGTTSTSGASRRGACGPRSASCSSGSRSPRSSARESVRLGKRDAGAADATRSWLVASPVLRARVHPARSRTGRPASRAGRHDDARLRARPAQLRRAVRHPRHRRRQRHVPALVRAGGRGHPADVVDRQHVAAQHRLVHAPDHPSPGVRVRRGNGSRHLSRRHLAQAEGPP